MGIKSFSVCATVVVFVAVFTHSHGLMCYSCKAASVSSGEDGCKNAPLETCTGNAVCISAKFITSEPNSHEQQIYTARSCFPHIFADPCAIFLNTVKQLIASSDLSIQIEYQDQCRVCSTDGCNSATGKTFSVFLLFGTLVSLFSKLF